MPAQRPLLFDRAIQIIADNKIRAAIEAGEFDNLSGLGKPAAIFDEPYDPHWWIRRKLKRENLAVSVSYCLALLYSSQLGESMEAHRRRNGSHSGLL